MTDVLVVGGGPAGWAVARACAERGLAVAVADPRPDRPWRQTYGSWWRELPPDLPAEVVAATGTGTAIAVREHAIDEHYAVLDSEALRRHLRHPAVTVHAARVVGAAPGRGVVLAGGRTLGARVVVDASGAAQVLSTRTRRGRVAEQTAFGVVVPDDVADRVTGGRLLFMDWRPRHGRPGPATFLYAVPLGGGRTLLEETSLVRRPGLPIAQLRDRLHRRLRACGVPSAAIPGGPADTEVVRFPVDTPTHGSPAGVVAVGAAAPVTHPASGFSVATSLRLGPRIAEALASPLPAPERAIPFGRMRRVGRGECTDPDERVRAARHVVRPPAATVVHAMRRRGLDVLLRMPSAQVPAFFEAFFALAPEHRRAYLDARDDVGASLEAMLALFVALPTPLRVRLITGSALGPGCVRMDDAG